jgi:membrane associated rhomboid family serine protease
MLQKNIKFASGFIALIWAVFLIDSFLPFLHLSSLGVKPRSVAGLAGILFMPFLHANLFHLISNSIPLFFLLFIALSYDVSSSLSAIALIIFFGGLGTWLFGAPHSVHIGASGLVFGLIGYLASIGFFRQSLKAAAVSLLVLFFYGGAILLMIIPMPGISLAGHISGFFAGVFAAKEL